MSAMIMMIGFVATIRDSHTGLNLLLKMFKEGSSSTIAGFQGAFHLNTKQSNNNFLKES